jgi:hypothetical protein
MSFTAIIAQKMHKNVEQYLKTTALMFVSLLICKEMMD